VNSAHSPFRILTTAPDGAPRDLETIKRSVLRKILGVDRRSSSPFLSGDSFKFLADVVLKNDTNDCLEELTKVQGDNPLVFAKGGPKSASLKLLGLCQQGFRFPNTRLIIHNSDEIPSLEEMDILIKSFKQIFSVNWLGNPKIVKPLPIGLENRANRRNGVPKDYSREIEKGLPSFEERDITFLICFNVLTNPNERTIAFNMTKDLPGAYVVREAITPKRYRNLVLRSKYVISPPGNGPDCHRTWESMYLGAMPIVKSDSWPFRHLDLPVIQTEDWSDLETLSYRVLPNCSMDWKNLESWL